MTDKKIPMRQCTGCREMKTKKEMIRVLKPAEGEGVILDATGKANGRGAYICRGLERSLKRSIPPEIYDQLRKEMEEIAKQ